MKHIAIIGGGLAGCALAYILKQRGHNPVIYESAPEIASGASGNDVGLYNPRFTATFDAQGQFYSAAFFMALETFAVLPNIDWNPCGALHLITDEKKAKRFPQTVQNWGWSEDDMRIASPSEASIIASVEITQDALYLSRSGTVSPRKLCAAYTHGIEIHLNQTIHNPEDIKADAVILANGMGAASHAPLKPVRGQVTYIKSTPASKNLRCTIGYGGYIAPAINGFHCLGSTFQPWLAHDTVMSQDNIDNIDKLGANIPVLAHEYEVSHARAAVRTTVKDHFPVIGEIGKNLYISTAHGSHGILSALMGAKIISDMIEGCENPADAAILTALSPSRFS